MHALYLNANCECFSNEEPVFIHHLLGPLNEYLSHSFHTFFFSFLKPAEDNHK